VNASKWNYHTPDDEVTFFMYKPPVIQPGCLRWKWVDPIPFVTNARYEEILTVRRIHHLLVNGVETTQVKQWVLYEQGYSA